MIFLYICMLVISLLFYILYKGSISFIIFALVYTLPIFQLAALLAAKRKINAKLIIPQSGSGAGEKIPAQIIISNGSRIPVSDCVITLEYVISSDPKKEKVKLVTPLFPKNTQRLSIPFSSEHYGVISCRISQIKIYDSLKIWRFKIREKNIIKTDSDIVFVPDSLELANPICDYADLGADSDKFSSVKPGDDASEIFDIRQYRNGDRMSRVHWKLTAKQDELMVKEYSLPLCDSCVIIADTFSAVQNCNCRKIYDAIVQLTASLSYHLAENGVRHTVCSYSEARKTLNSYGVFDADSYAEASVKLVLDGVCTKPFLAEKAYLSGEENLPRCGHLIIVTASFDENIFAQLCENQFAVRRTVLLCNETEAVLSGDYSTAEEYDVISVDCGAIAESLEELIL